MEWIVDRMERVWVTRPARVFDGMPVGASSEKAVRVTLHPDDGGGGVQIVLLTEEAAQNFHVGDPVVVAMHGYRSY